MRGNLVCKWSGQNLLTSLYISNLIVRTKVITYVVLEMSQLREILLHDCRYRKDLNVAVENLEGDSEGDNLTSPKNIGGLAERKNENLVLATRAIIFSNRFAHFVRSLYKRHGLYTKVCI